MTHTCGTGDAAHECECTIGHDHDTLAHFTLHEGRTA